MWGLMLGPILWFIEWWSSLYWPFRIGIPVVLLVVSFILMLSGYFFILGCCERRSKSAEDVGDEGTEDTFVIVVDETRDDSCRAWDRLPLYKNDTLSSVDYSDTDEVCRLLDVALARGVPV